MSLPEVAWKVAVAPRDYLGPVLRDLGSHGLVADPDLLESYNRIFNHRGDSAVVELSGGICRGCNMKVTPACINAAKAEKSLTTCPNCGRFVYFTDL